MAVISLNWRYYCNWILHREKKKCILSRVLSSVREKTKGVPHRGGPWPWRLFIRFLDSSSPGAYLTRKGTVYGADWSPRWTQRASMVARQWLNLSRGKSCLHTLSFPNILTQLQIPPNPAFYGECFISWQSWFGLLQEMDENLANGLQKKKAAPFLKKGMRIVKFLSFPSEVTLC